MMIQDLGQVTKDLGEVVNVIKIGGGATLAYLILKQTFGFITKMKDSDKAPPNGNGKARKPCKEAEEFILMADKVGRTESLTAANNRILTAMVSDIERTADSNERQEKILVTLSKTLMEGK